MQANTELYLIHGWGFDGNVWNNWLPSIKNDVTTYIFDRGYFKAYKQNFSFKVSKRFKIVIAHSFGLHFLSSLDFSQIHMLILISSFRHFHDHKPDRKLSHRQIATMKAKLMRQPSSLLMNFYSNCGLTSKDELPTIIHTQLLYDDLSHLNSNQIDLHLLKPIRQILLLHGQQDKIADLQHSNELHKKLSNSKLFVHSEAGHSLPISDSQWCLNTIQSELSKKIITT